eukprot:357682-Chlamydomonas_euryale.AAC.3
MEVVGQVGLHDDHQHAEEARHQRLAAVVHHRRASGWPSGGEEGCVEQDWFTYHRVCIPQGASTQSGGISKVPGPCSLRILKRQVA